MAKLYCYPYKIGFMSTDYIHYDSLLRSTRLPYTDLVVREAIQNSLDAASSECDLDFVEVNFQTGFGRKNQKSCLYFRKPIAKSIKICYDESSKL